MKNCIFISCLFFFSIYGISQNLVPNPGFENYTTCPTAASQISYAVPWYGVTSAANSTDYYNTCGLTSYMQNARTGNGQAAIWVFHSLPDYREYIQVPIISSLPGGKCYFVEYYVNLHNTMKYALPSIDAYFSDTAINSTGTGYVLNLSPQIKKFGFSAIKDTIAWTKISAIYLASGGEQYLTIGNFSDDLNTDTTNTGNSYYGSYYYIDDVSIIPIDSIPGGMPAYAGNDTNVVIGDSVFIGQEISNLNCNWYDSSGTLIAGNTSGIYVHPTNTTHYVVEQNLCGNITYDTVNVTVLPLNVNDKSISRKITVYPNPGSGKFSISGFSLDITELNIKAMDVNGKIVFNEKISSGERLFDLTLDAPDGIYMIIISNPQTNENFVKRMVIQK
jgi:hypothetical protein